MKARDLLGSKIDSPLHRQLQELGSNIGFGDGSPGKRAGNHAGNVVSYQSNAQAGTKDAIPHKLGRVPDHFFPTLPGDQPGAAVQFLGADSENVYVSCNVPGTNFKFYVE